ncbi:MAG: type II toxin-antitoxin system Phd/YefM family antitoxin [bacterium]
MRFIPVRELRIRPGYVWKELKKEHELIVTSNGKPFALLSEVKEDNFESSILALRQSRAFLAMEAMQLRAVKEGLHKLSLDEIEAEIKAVRKRK